MITVRKRLISMLLAIALVLSLFTLLPEGALKAHALSGSGTQSNPYIVTTYDELYKLLIWGGSTEMENWYNNKREVYIKLGADIISEDTMSDYEILTNYQAVIHIDLAGHLLCRMTNKTLDGYLIYNHADLYIDDSVGGGKMKCNLPLKHNIDGALIENYGKLVIYNGEFKNDNEGSHYVEGSFHDTYTINNYGELYIYNGKFGTCNLNNGYGDTDAGDTVIYNGNFEGNVFSDNCITKIYAGKFGSIFGYFEIYGGTFNYYYAYYGDYITQIYSATFEKGVDYSDDTLLTKPSSYGSTYLDKYIYEYATVTLDGKPIPRSTLATKWRLQGNKLTIVTPQASKADIKVIPPRDGETRSAPTLNSGEVIIAGWNIRDMTTNEIVSSTDKFVQYRPYRYEVTLVPKQGYYFHSSPRITMNGNLSTDITETAKQMIMAYRIFYCDAALESIDSLSIGTVVPRDGASLSAPWTSADGFTIGKSEWYKGDRLLVNQKMSPTDKFTEGQQYTFYCEVYADEGYKFASDAPAYVNSKRAQTVKYTDRIGVKYTFTALKSNTLPMFSIGIQEPKAGEVIDRAVKSISPADKNITVYGASGTTKNVVSWARTDGVMLTSGSKFSAGVTYRVTVRLSQSIKLNDTAPDRLYLTDDTVVMIGGKQANYLGNSDIYRTYQVSFTVPEETEHFLKGDVNGDGEVDRIDANLLSRFVAGWDGYESRIYKDVADLNGDGNVDRIDANILSRCVADWDGYRDKYIK